MLRRPRCPLSRSLLILATLAACRQPQYATADGEASVRLTPVDGSGMTIEADGLYVQATDFYDDETKAYASRGVGVYDQVAAPGDCFEGEVELKLELIGSVSMWLTGPGTDGAVVFGDNFDEPEVGLEAEGAFTGPLDVYSAAVAVCEGLEPTVHDLVVEWSVDESTRVVHYDKPDWDGLPCVGCTN